MCLICDLMQQLVIFFWYDGIIIREGFLKTNCLCLAVFFEIGWMQIMRHEPDEIMFVLWLLHKLIIVDLRLSHFAITLWYEYQFSFTLKVGVIIVITNILQLHLCFKKRDWKWKWMVYHHSSLTLHSFLECLTGRGSKPWLLKIAATVVQSLS